MTVGIFLSMLVDNTSNYLSGKNFSTMATQTDDNDISETPFTDREWNSPETISKSYWVCSCPSCPTWHSIY